MYQQHTWFTMGLEKRKLKSAVSTVLTLGASVHCHGSLEQGGI